MALKLNKQEVFTVADLARLVDARVYNKKVVDDKFTMEHLNVLKKIIMKVERGEEN